MLLALLAVAPIALDRVRLREVVARGYIALARSGPADLAKPLTGRRL